MRTTLADFKQKQNKRAETEGQKQADISRGKKGRIEGRHKDRNRSRNKGK